MTRFVALTALLALAAGCGPAGEDTESEAAALTPAFVQVGFSTPQNPTQVVSVTLGRAEAAGDANVVVIGWNDITSTVLSLVDSQGLVYQVAAPVTRNANGPNSQEIFFAPGTHAGSDTVTITMSGAVVFPDLRVLEYSGVNALDTSAGAAGMALLASAGPVTTTTATDLLVGAGTTYGAFSTSGIGFARRVLTQPDLDLVEDRVTVTSGNYTATAHNDGAQWVFQVAAFKHVTATDAGADAAPDGSLDAAADTTPDTQVDMGAADAASDASDSAILDGTSDVSESGADAVTEASADVAAEAAMEAGPDAGQDATMQDAGADVVAETWADAPIDSTVDSGQPFGPTLVQHTSSSTNPLGKGESGGTFQFSLPNPQLSQNCLVLGISYGFGGVVQSITDSLGEIWPINPSTTATDGANLTSAIYVLPNTTPGLATITVTFTRNVQPFHYTLSELAGISDEPVDGTSSGVGLATPTFTPSRDGSLVWSYFSDIGIFSHQATSVASGAGFTLLDADIAWPDQGVPHASQYLVQGAATSVVPSMTVTQPGGADTFLGVSVALSPAAGRGALPAPGIRVVRVTHGTNETPPASWTVQLPSIGNLLVVSTADWSDLLPVASVTDTNGNAWIKAEFDLSSPQIWYAPNAVSSADLKITLHLSGGAQPASLELWDIVGASLSPFDVMAGVPLLIDSHGANLVGVPVLTPTGPGLTIASLAMAQGPASGVTSPAGAVFDMVFYNGETDFDTLDNADGTGHAYNSDTAPQSWNWSVNNGHANTEYSATAVHFRSQ